MSAVRSTTPIGRLDPDQGIEERNANNGSRSRAVKTTQGATMSRTLTRGLLAAALAWGGYLGMAAAADVDEAAAQALIKKSDCGKCHAVDKKKDGPPYKETAAKYKGKPTAEDDLYKHLTTAPKVKIDGKEEEHKKVNSTNEAEVRNLVRYILTR
jgi:cytochrome c